MASESQDSFFGDGVEGLVSGRWVWGVRGFFAVFVSEKKFYIYILLALHVTLRKVFRWLEWLFVALVQGKGSWVRVWGVFLGFSVFGDFFFFLFRTGLV